MLPVQAENHIPSPTVGFPDIAQSCGVEWAGPRHVSAGTGGCSVLVARSFLSTCPKVWATSVVLPL